MDTKEMLNQLALQKEQAEQELKENREIIKRLISDNVLPPAKKLSRKQRKDLDKTGNDISKISKDDKRSFLQIRDDMVDWILDTIYPDFNFDELDNDVCTAFALYTYNISIKDVLAEKN